MTNTTSNPVPTSARPLRAPTQAAEFPNAPQPAGGTDLAARIMSETAHDLRSPLTTVRESVRLVHDEDLGLINPEQRQCLADALNQCECIEQMIGEMVGLDRLRNGIPRARRQWITVASVKQSIDQTLRPWALPREIRVAWDGIDDPNLIVFADTDALRRLVVNLATNAIRATAEGQAVLISLEPVRDSEAIRWTVADQGAGIAESNLRQIASQQVSHSGGEGLGLMICRQLAALHFSDLTIRSQPGVGTQVSFEVAAKGPRSVATCWTRWRTRGMQAERTAETFRNESTKLHQGSSVIRGPRRPRGGPPSVSIELSLDRHSPLYKSEFAIGTVTLGAAMSIEAADEFDALLQNRLQMFDLAYRVDTRRWVWVFDADRDSANMRIESLTDIASKQIKGLRLNWSDAQVLPLDRRRTTAILSDLMIRETLISTSAMNLVDQDDVRPGTLPIEPSQVASTRLDQEMQRLSSRFRDQTSALREQVNKLRP